MNNDNNNENISFFLHEEELVNTQPDIINIHEIPINSINSINNINNINTVDLYNNNFVPHIINYHENFTVKELLIICDYYGILKEVKSKKFNKDEIIHFLVEFELKTENNDVVFKRKNMWFYINELKNDNFMKKYILW